MNRQDVQHALERFGVPTGNTAPIALGNAGGFSGAMLWKLTVGSDEYCLRRWPSPKPKADRLQSIHQAIFTAQSAGVDCLPVPIPDLDGSSFIVLDNHFWELTHWLPGEASFLNDPSAAKITNAFTWLASFHKAVANLTNVRSAIAPAVSQRIEILEKLNNGGAQLIGNAVQMNREKKLDFVNEDLLADRMVAIVRRQADSVLAKLSKFRAESVPIQFCIRDIWNDHLLFVDDKLTGVVDFGACNTDVVSTDIARLAGSMLGNDSERWKAAIEAYKTVRPLSGEESQLIPVLDSGTILISGMNWLRWLFVENRRFDDLPAVRKRLQLILARLKSLDEQTDFAI